MSLDDIKHKIEELREELHQHNYNYYVLDTPSISDYEFDMMLEELKELELAYPEFADNNSPTQRVGGNITKNFPTVEHRHRMYSLDNSYNFEDLSDWQNRLIKSLDTTDIEYVAELKYDGASISILYENGAFKQAITRGDGFQGDEITANVKTISDIPLKIKGEYPNTFYIRGEIYLTKKHFNLINKAREKRV